MITYIVLGLLGMAVTLAGTTTKAWVLIPVGAAIIIGAFFWFVRARQRTPIYTQDHGASQ